MPVASCRATGLRHAVAPGHIRRVGANIIHGQKGAAGSSAQYHIDTVKDLRTRLRPKAPDPLGEK
jgi:hypothetical protein